jgi:diguanylate cyclase (GGDEF)-like protein
LVARLGGDEFAILQVGVSDLSIAGILASKIQLALSTPHAVEGSELSISASIGITVCRPEAQGPAELLVQADQALYRAKADGRAQYQFYSAEC